MTVSRRFLILGTLCLLYDTMAAQSLDSILTDALKCAVSATDVRLDDYATDEYLGRLPNRASEPEGICADGTGGDV